MLNWNDLQYLLALKEGGTMKRAAELLNTNATTVSRRIKKLSEENGRLLVAPHKGEAWQMTPEADRLIRLAEDFNRRLASLNDPEQDELETTFTLTSLDFLITYYIAPNVHLLRREHPELRLVMTGADRRLSLAFREADLALRFGRPVEGQLLAKKVADVRFRAYRAVGANSMDWVGMTEDLEWTPDMVMAQKIFGRPPIVRASSYAAAKRAAVSLGCGTVGPVAIMGGCPNLEEHPSEGQVSREVWSIIHESRKLDRRLEVVRQWAEDLFRARREGRAARDGASVSPLRTASP